jgi:hypothetical protein
VARFPQFEREILQHLSTVRELEGIHIPPPRQARRQQGWYTLSSALEARSGRRLSGFLRVGAALAGVALGVAALGAGGAATHVYEPPEPVGRVIERIESVPEAIGLRESPLPMPPAQTPTPVATATPRPPAAATQTAPAVAPPPPTVAPVFTPSVPISAPPFIAPSPPPPATPPMVLPSPTPMATATPPPSPTPQATHTPTPTTTPSPTPPLGSTRAPGRNRDAPSTANTVVALTPDAPADGGNANGRGSAKAQGKDNSHANGR